LPDASVYLTEEEFVLLIQLVQQRCMDKLNHGDGVDFEVALKTKLLDANRAALLSRK
jgi:hypothetical protein